MTVIDMAVKYGVDGCLSHNIRLEEFAKAVRAEANNELEALKRERAMLVTMLKKVDDATIECEGDDGELVFSVDADTIHEARELLSSTEQQSQQWLAEKKAEALEEAASIIEDEDEHLRIDSHVHSYAERLRRLAASTRNEQV